MTDSIETQIMAALKAKISELTWLKSVEFEVVRNLFTDFPESALPAVQVFDRAPAVVQHSRTLIDVQWPLAIELVLKTSKEGRIDQSILFNRKKEIQDKLSTYLSLGGTVPGFKQLRYDGFETDLHSQPGFFAVSLNMTAMYTDRFPGC